MSLIKLSQCPSHNNIKYYGYQEGDNPQSNDDTIVLNGFNRWLNDRLKRKEIRKNGGKKYDEITGASNYRKGSMGHFDWFFLLTWLQLDLLQ